MSAVRWGQAIDNAALAVEIEGFCTLLALLAAEQDALRTADADALARIVPQKLTQVHALRSMSVARTALLRSAGLAATAAGMRTLLARSPEPERAQHSPRAYARTPRRSSDGDPFPCGGTRCDLRRRWAFAASCAVTLSGSELRISALTYRAVRDRPVSAA